MHVGATFVADARWPLRARARRTKNCPLSRARLVSPWVLPLRPAAGGRRTSCNQLRPHGEPAAVPELGRRVRRFPQLQPGATYFAATTTGGMYQRRGHRVQRAPLERGRSETAQKFAFSALAATTACPFCVRHLARRVLSATQTRDMQGFSGSPLTDSNRRPPPSHGGFRFRGVVRRIVLAEPFPRYFRDSSAARPLL